MHTPQPSDTLLLAQARGDELRATATAERVPTTSAARRLMAATLRRLADRVDHAQVLPTAAGQC